jgi:cob(I)alamin adenosyltransferase
MSASLLLTDWQDTTRLDVVQQSALDALNALLADQSASSDTAFSFSDPHEGVAVTPLLQADMWRRTTSQSSSSTPSTVTADAAAELSPQFLMYQETITHYEHMLAGLLDKVENLSAGSLQVEQRFRSVEEKTNSVRQVCEKLLADHERTLAKANRLESHLKFFAQVQTLTTRTKGLGLTTTSAHQQVWSLDASEEYVGIVRTLEQCLQYSRSHIRFSDARSCLVDFQRLQLKVVGMIRAYIQASLDGVSQNIKKHRLELQAEMEAMRGGGDQLGSSATMFHGGSSVAAFVEVKRVAAQLAPLIREVEARGSTNPTHRKLLVDVYQIYHNQRHSYLFEDANAYLAFLDKTSDLATLARCGCSYLVELCSLETQLFLDFFAWTKHSAAELRNLEAALCMLLYKYLRPRIIHENSVDELAGLFITLSQEAADSSATMRNTQTSSSSSSSSSSPDLVVDELRPVVLRLSQDIQERLAYRAHVYLQEEVLRFRPSSADLAHYKKLLFLSSSSASTDAKVVQQQQQQQHQALQWFPPVSNTLICLAKLYRCLEQNIFQYLANEAVGMCLESLTRATKQVTADEDVQIHQCLFHISHLITLREQIAPFDVDFTIVSEQIDLQYVRKILPDIWRAARQPEGFWSSWRKLGPSKVVQEVKTDSKLQLETDLKGNVNTLALLHTQVLAGPADAFLAHAAGRDPRREGQDAFAAETVAVVKECVQGIDARVAAIRKMYNVYLSDPGTEMVLFRASKASALSRMAKIRSLVELHLAGPEDLEGNPARQEQVQDVYANLQYYEAALNSF